MSCYKAAAPLARAFAEPAPNLTGYADADVEAAHGEVAFHTEIRAAIKNHAGEEPDLKPPRNSS